MNHDENQQALGVIILIGVAVIAGPALLAKLGMGLTSWGLQHHILVANDQAVIALPGTGAGLDGHRATILALTLIALTAATILIRKARQETAS